ncbi:MAG: VanZ family protein [Phocaeicola sp.]
MQIYYYLTNYPFSLCTLLAIGYLSFFTPPQTELSEINNFDKLAHIAMYGGLCTLLWIEYLRCHSTFSWRKATPILLLFPLLLSGIIELLQAYCTTNRGGEWLDFGANALGISIASLIGYTLLLPFIHKK